MKQQIPIMISIAAIISASISAIAAASAQEQFSTFTGPDGKFSIEHPSDWFEHQPTSGVRTSYHQYGYSFNV